MRRFFSSKKRRGFTLIELLAVIVILSIIAVIIVPVVSNMIEGSRKKAFMNSVYNAGNAIKEELSSDDFADFPSGGIDATTGVSSLEKNPFIGGRFKQEKQKIIAARVTDGRYCATGTREDLKVVFGPCYLLDDTAPVSTLKVNQVTSKSITVIMDAYDEESEIVGYQFSKDGGKTYSALQKANSYTFNNLNKNTKFNIKAKVINENDLVTESSIDVTTLNFSAPTITSSPALSTWSTSKTITITYPARQTGLIFEYSTNNCATWTTLASGTTHSFTMTANGNITARVRDGYDPNTASSVTYTITTIDTTKPSVPTSQLRYDSSTGTVRSNVNSWTNRTIWWGNFSATDTGSGIDHYEYSTDCTGSKSGNLNSYHQYTGNTNYTFCIRAVDKVGNISDWSGATYIKIDKTSPTCSSSGGGGWTTGNRTISGSCSDTGGSGCTGNVSKSYTSEIHGNYSPGTVYDGAGNSVACPNQTVAIDRTKPYTPVMTSFSYTQAYYTYSCTSTGKTQGNVSCSFTAKNGYCRGGTTEGYTLHGDTASSVNSGYTLQYQFSCTGSGCYHTVDGSGKKGNVGVWTNISNPNTLNWYAGSAGNGVISRAYLYLRLVDGAGNVSGTFTFTQAWCV